MRTYSLTWEQAVTWLRDSPQHQQLSKHCYFDDPHLDAAKRFWTSDEWLEVRNLLPENKGTVLDIGAGRGISSFAFAMDGWIVTALEPNPSSLVGADAIRRLFRDQKLSIDIQSEEIEKANLPSEFYDLIYCRQMLHHAQDLNKTCQQIGKALRKGGYFLATREHVVNNSEDLQIFLNNHPLHSLYGGEYAYSLRRYLSAIEGANLSIEKVFHPYSSVINTYPLQPALALRNKIQRVLRSKRLVSAISVLSESNNHLLRKSLNPLPKLIAMLDRTPGRLYSFLAKKK